MVKEEYSQFLKVPKERVAVLIGVNGETKRTLEKEIGIRVDITKDGEVTLTGESYNCWNAAQIVKAIARGFSPEKAFKLLDEEYVFEIIELKDLTDSEKDMERMKGRVIGRDGRSREIIEEMTGCDVSIYGKTISMLGKCEEMAIAKKAVIMLLEGAMHTTVFKFLEKERRI